MGQHKKECRKNYLKRRRKMLKERKTQDEDPTSHLPEEESTSSPAERVVDEPNPKKRRGNDSHATFVLMHNTALLVNYHLSCTLTP